MVLGIKLTIHLLFSFLLTRNQRKVEAEFQI